MTLGDEIRFSAGQIDQIGAEAEAAYPEECCGLLVGVLKGHVYEVSRVVASPNVAETRARDRFEVDPQVLHPLSAIGRPSGARRGAGGTA